jgi:hypothetical protein
MYLECIPPYQTYFYIIDALTTLCMLEQQLHQMQDRARCISDHRCICCAFDLAALSYVTDGVGEGRLQLCEGCVRRTQQRITESFDLAARRLIKIFI